MGKVAALRDRFKKITLSIVDKTALEIVKRHQQYMIDLNHVQLLHNKGDDGKSLGIYASESYALFKEELNPAAQGGVDLKLTGAFHNSFFVVAKKFPVFVDARDKKKGALVEKYGKHIFNLDNANKELFVNDIKKELKVALKKKFLGV